ncbi:OmpH family outer membrane protein [Mameliella alba]|nr:OmpH family outer membrane protein [Antarctobacter heliothermus]MBY6144079.1 OmpH family outer membrane protein [Mameliella alba]MBY6161629.1 OmpH family outer membrane protein [Mameliella alba]MBY6169905.1 OmpH family outer membrane protein [Mameliella alba]MBY6175118.1 OmpH family outer membrane protein [Mameliella alba]
MRLALRFAVLLLALWGAAAVAQGQGGPFATGVRQSPILVIDFERVFSESAFGRRVNAEIEQQGRAIAAENRKIEAELIEEERKLTDLRPTLAPDEFRKLADAFDEKVQTLRDEQDAKARALGSQTEDARRRFLGVAQPVLEGLLREAGAVLILERRTVFVAADTIDVTERAIALIDAQIGDGTPADPDPTPGPETPDPQD